MGRRTLVLVGFMSLAFGTALCGQARWEQQVQSQLSSAGDYLQDRGFSLTHEIQNGSLDEATSEDFWVQLEPGMEYAFMGVCDEDCGDIDLELFDDGGTSIDADYQEDDAPLVRITPSRAARFRVHVYLASCSVEPCYYGVGVYGRTAGSGSEWETQVEQQISSVGQRLEQDGYYETHDPRIGSLDDGESEDFNIRLQSGLTYSIVAVCDNDCSDVDLVVYDMDNNEVDSDYQSDDIPVLGIRPGATAQFRVHVFMSECTTEPCYYGVGVYGRKGT